MIEYKTKSWLRWQLIHRRGDCEFWWYQKDHQKEDRLKWKLNRSLINSNTNSLLNLIFYLKEEEMIDEFGHKIVVKKVKN